MAGGGRASPSIPLPFRRVYPPPSVTVGLDNKLDNNSTLWYNSDLLTRGNIANRDT